MFYSQDILQKRGGKFGVIWIAATKAGNLSKRDYASVNIRRTCEDLIRYITVQAEAVRAGGPRPRFSLYLSAQLMYGVISVFQKQQMYLFADVTSLSTRFKMFNLPSLEIDLKEQHKTLENINIHDVVGEFHRASDTPAMDPCFGLLKSLNLADWHDIPEMDCWTPPSPTLDLLVDIKQQDIAFPPSPKTPQAPFRPVFGSPLQAHPDSITLKEALPAQKDIPVEGEVDLPPLGDLDTAHPQPDGATTTFVEQTSLETLEAILSPIPKQALIGEILDHGQGSGGLDLDVHRLGPAEETPMVFPELDSTMAPPAAPERAPEARSPPITPVQEAPQVAEARRAGLVDYQMTLSPVAETASARRRRRQLNFADAEIQLPRKRVREQLEHGEATCNVFEPAGPEPSSVKDLFSKPGKKEWHHPRFLHLWARNAISRDFEETDSDRLRPAWTVHDLMLGEHGSSSSGSMRGSPREQMEAAAGAMDQPSLSPVMTEQTRAINDSDSRLERTLEALRRTAEGSMDQSGLERAGRMTPHASLLSDAGLPADSLLARDKDSFTGEKRSRRGSSFEASAGPDDITLTMEDTLTAHRSIQDLGTVPELAEDIARSAEAQPRAATAELPLIAEVSPRTVGTPPKRQRLSGPEDEEWQEKMSSPTHRRIRRLFEGLTVTGSFTTFKELCPFTNNRQQASRVFSALLNFAAVQVLELQQDEPYGDIYITQGRNY